MRDDEDPVLRRRAKAMRRAMTPAERRLCWALRHRLELVVEVNRDRRSVGL